MTWVAGVWRHPRWGRPIRVVAGLAAIPIVVNLVVGQPAPAGQYLQGVVLGGLYGLLAMGLVLVYRASRVINFAQANLGAAPAVLGLILFAARGLPYWLALLLVLIGSPLLGAVVDRFVVRPFSRAPRLIFAVVLIGVGQALAGVEALTPGWVSGEALPPLDRIKTPFGGSSVEIGGVFFSGDHLLAVVVVIVVAAGLGAFLRFTAIGIAVRASAENGDRAALLGIPVQKVSTVVWMVAGLLSGLGIFLRAPLVGLPVGGQIGPVILLFALAAAVIAKMESLPGALLAGVAIGMLDQGVYYGFGFKPNISTALMLPILLVALLVQRGPIARAADTGVATWQAVKEFRPVPPELRKVREVVLAGWALRLVVAAVVVGAPLLVGELNRSALIKVVLYAMVGVSLVVLTGWAGQISLGQFAFAGVGAAIAGGLAADAGWDFFVCVSAGGLFGAAAAVIIGIPALRIQGLFLAVTTLAFATNLQSFFLNRDYFGWLLPEPSNVIERPILWGRLDVSSDLAFSYVSLVALALAVLAARSLRSSRSGRVLISTRDNARAAQSYGVNLARTRLAAFAIAGFMAATAGALLAYRSGAVDAGLFTPQESIAVFTMTVIGGLTSIPGAIAGAVFVVGSQELLSTETSLLVTGVGVILILRFFPGGLAEAGFRARDAFLRSMAARNGLRVPSLVADSAVVEQEPETPLLLAQGEAASPVEPFCPACDAPVPLDEVRGHVHFVAARSRDRVAAAAELGPQDGALVGAPTEKEMA